MTKDPLVDICLALGVNMGKPKSRITKTDAVSFLTTFSEGGQKAWKEAYVAGSALVCVVSRSHAT